MEQFTIETRTGRGWRVDDTITDPGRVHESLMHDLIAKKLHRCTYITSISDRNNYDGTRTIIVNFDGDLRRVYTIKF